MAKSVLVVEDDFSIREELDDVLGRFGYEVHNAANGREALSVLWKMREPALILTDLLMPIMDGETFLEAVRSVERFRKIPAVVVSVKAGPVRGAQAHLRKPFDLPVLLSVVRAYAGPGDGVSA